VHARHFNIDHESRLKIKINFRLHAFLIAGHGRTRHLASLEDFNFGAQVAKVKAWFSTERFKRCARRPYSAEDVVRLRAPLPCEYQSDFTAKKMWAMCNELRSRDGYSHTFGCLDTVQVL
jgi:hypothetical protein